MAKLAELKALAAEAVWARPLDERAREAGCAYLFGTPGDPGGRLNHDEKSHHSYAHHICNEVEIEEPYKGGMRRRWKERSENTHWLDASYYTNVGANIKGIKPLKPKPAVPAPAAKPRRKVAYQ